MNEPSLRSITPTIDIYIRLAQYPILADTIRERMRRELYRRGIITEDGFEYEVQQLSLASQLREGLSDPFAEEDSFSWQMRLERVRDFHTDAYFANNLGIASLDRLIDDVLNSQAGPTSDWVDMSFNPEVAPWEMLFRQGEAYERLPEEEQDAVRHHLEEIKVVLIRRLMSDQLPFIGVAKRVLKISDLRLIYQSLLGTGKIGGKAAGMILAWRSLQSVEEVAASGSLEIPDTFFVGTDVLYEFILMNKLEDYMNQKYLPISDIRAEHPQVVEAFRQGQMPEYIVTQLREVLVDFDSSPIIVRSSSLLEDSFDSSFAGKYKSFFCPNTGTPEENLADVLDAIQRTYASTLSPDALLYRRKHDLIDYDERMAVMIQRVSGQQHGRYFFPDIAGLAFSHNSFRWSEEIREEDGLLRIVAGLGTRAVERVSQDYPRLVALSHPTLRPEKTIEAQRRYSQRFMAVVDAVENRATNMPILKALGNDHHILPHIAQLDRGDTLEPITVDTVLDPDERIILTFDGLCRDEAFTAMMKAILRRLEEVYQGPIGVEFAIQLASVEDKDHTSSDAGTAMPTADLVKQLQILECRPQSKRSQSYSMADDQPEPDVILFKTPTLLPSMQLEDIRYLVYIDPDAYYQIQEEETRSGLSSV
ncbi:MAG: PEP/pyruvate-binding domain-containing protein [Chloroflexota bacterium]